MKSARGQALRLSAENQPAPEWLLDAMRLAKIGTRRLIGCFFAIGTGRWFLPAFEQELERCTALWIVPHEAAAHALRAAIVYGFKREVDAMRHALPPPMQTHLDYVQALCQQELTLALWKLPPDMRQAFLDRTDILHTDEDWRREVAGANTAARVIHAALEAQMEVRLAPVEDDTLRAGDLLLSMPGTCHRFYTQVTGDGSTKDVRVQLLHDQPTVFQDQRGKQRAVWNGAQAFSHAKHEKWLPLYVHVGLRGQRPSELEHPLLARRLRQFLTSVQRASRESKLLAVA